MPTYDYRCEGCEHTFETFRSMKDESPEKCPACKGEETVRVPSMPHTDLKEFSSPIEQYSIAMNSLEEVQEFKRKCPDVQCSEDFKDPMFGIPIARNRKQKLAALKAKGFQESK